MPMRSRSLPNTFIFYFTYIPKEIFMKKIAFSCSTEDDRYFLKHNYIKYLLWGAQRCGVSILPMILPPCADKDMIRRYAEEFDGFIFPGGGDIFPTKYGAEHVGLSNDFNIPRDKFELALIPEIVSLNKPVLGICRGIQVMAVALGSTLWQDIAAEALKNTHAADDGMGSPSHKVELIGEGVKIFKKSETVTNSYHHQAIRNLSACLTVEAYSEDGVIEAVSCPSLRYYRAVQWHPEIPMNDDSAALIDSFIKSLL